MNLEVIYSVMWIISWIAGTITTLAFFAWIAIERPAIIVTTIVFLIITIVSIGVRINIVTNETTITEETVTATVTSKDIIKDCNNIKKCYVSIVCSDNSAETLWVTGDEYARVQEGSNVPVIKTTETLFGNEEYSYDIVF